MTQLIDTRITHEDKVNFLIGFLLVLCACFLITSKVLVGSKKAASNTCSKSASSVVLSTGGREIHDGAIDSYESDINSLEAESP